MATQSRGIGRRQAAALRRAGDLRATRRFAVGLRRALPERFAGFFAAGLVAFFFAVFAMSCFSLFLAVSFSAQYKATILTRQNMVLVVNHALTTSTCRSLLCPLADQVAG